ncbi:hypothetical protein PPACK8108_LOCUS6833 [Phakopsora pachyrhizi]|uniref:Uncharacterized protein n=1 Tax=Phakopsora pachyrhizi TaxID=170000 RepID=A0AAV0AV83_PHAPC|nr:hypothetical protein PPACK8108_LOCUS6833 [Phakopsora pachyrhizi]
MLKAYDNQHSLECHSKFRLDKGEILNRDPENHSENLLLFERDIVPSPIDFNYELSEGAVLEKALEMGEGETGNNGFDLKDFRQVGADSEIVKRFEEETRKYFKEKFESIDRSRKSFREEIDEDNCHDKKVSYFYLKSPAGHQGFSSRLE